MVEWVKGNQRKEGCKEINIPIGIYLVLSVVEVASSASRATQLRRLAVRGKQGDQSAKQMN